MGRKHSRHAHRNKRSRRRLEYSSDESSNNTDDSNHVSRRKTTKHSRQQQVHTSQHNKTSSNTSECGRRNTRGDRRSNGVGSRNAATGRDCCTPILAMEEQRPTPQISTPVPGVQGKSQLSGSQISRARYKNVWSADRIQPWITLADDCNDSSDEESGLVKD
ncbi:hypothetical protein ACJJTC_001610 [Scirpophaga incertulas]